MSQKFFHLVKTQIFYEFLKLALSKTRPSIRENGTSDVISNHCKSCFLCGIKCIKDWSFVERTSS